MLPYYGKNKNEQPRKRMFGPGVRDILDEIKNSPEYQEEKIKSEEQKN